MVVIYITYLLYPSNYNLQITFIGGSFVFTGRLLDDIGKIFGVNYLLFKLL